MLTIEQIRELLADPSALTDAKLAEIRESVRSLATEGTDSVPLEDLRTLRDARAAVVAEQDTRAAAAAERAELLAELEDPPAPEAPAEPEPEPAAPEGETAHLGSEATPAEPSAPESDGGAQAAPAGQEQAVAASGRKAPTGSIGKADKPADTRPAIIASAVAAGGTSTFAAGAPIGDFPSLVTAMDEARAGLTKSRVADGERRHVVRVSKKYPEQYRLSNDASWAANEAKMDAATTSLESLTAAGGLCAPPQTLYDIDVIGSSARPIRDALTPFNVERGAIQYRPHASAAAAVNGVGKWSMDNDEAAGIGVDDPVKLCYEVPCPGLQDAEIWAAYQCLEFSNITARFDPESTASNVRQGVIAHARLAENLLLEEIMATSKVVYAGTQEVGAVRHILVELDKILAYYRNRHRITEDVSLTWLAPAWVRNMLRADLAYQMAAGDWQQALSVSQSMINTWLSARGVTPAWHLDGGIGGTNEVQTVTITGTPTGGSFTLTFDGQTTAAIDFDGTAADVAAALKELSNITVDEVTTAGGPFPGTAVTVTFHKGAGVDVPQMTATGSLTGGTTPAVAVTTTTTPSGTTTVNGVSIPSQIYGNVAAGSEIPEFPAKIDSALWVTGTKLFLDGGTLDLGMVRDHMLNARNRYRQFFETFEGVADRGIESLRVVIPAFPNGMSAGTADLIP